MRRGPGRGAFPLAAALARAAVVLPFALVFAAVTAGRGPAARGAMLVVKSYLSAAAVLLLVATTPLPALLRGLEGLGVPRFLLMVAQFLYRYLFVISEEAQHMRDGGGLPRGRRTARGRCGVSAPPRAPWRCCSPAPTRAPAQIHRAMLARGFEGQLPAAGGAALRLAPTRCSCSPAAAVPLLARFALGGGL